MQSWWQQWLLSLGTFLLCFDMVSVQFYDVHKKVDRIVIIVFLVGLNVASVMYEEEITLILAVGPILFTLVLEVIRTYMQWKYSSNKTNYLVSVSGTIMLLIFMAVFFLFINPLFVY